MNEIGMSCENGIENENDMEILKQEAYEFFQEEIRKYLGNSLFDVNDFINEICSEFTKENILFLENEIDNGKKIEYNFFINPDVESYLLKKLQEKRL